MTKPLLTKYGLIEWRVARRAEEPAGPLIWHTEGAQGIFGLQTAQKIAKRLGPPWEVRRLGTNELPDKD